MAVAVVVPGGSGVHRRRFSDKSCKPERQDDGWEWWRLTCGVLVMRAASRNDKMTD
ncbi:hypothetical protein HanIR_Chr17g0893001 [Helianthus annuus]|nr:hypothetical protein HanIR_Chr17g0893001 [Helianthus annuus]